MLSPEKTRDAAERFAIDQPVLDRTMIDGGGLVVREQGIRVNARFGAGFGPVRSDGRQED